jgi:hypothetical protein
MTWFSIFLFHPERKKKQQQQQKTKDGSRAQGGDNQDRRADLDTDVREKRE